MESASNVSGVLMAVLVDVATVLLAVADGTVPTSTTSLAVSVVHATPKAAIESISMFSHMLLC